MKKKACFILLVAISAACGSSDRNSGRPTPRPITGFSLSSLNDSVWQSECLVNEKGDGSAVVTYTLGESTLDKVTSYFHGPECREAKLFAQRSTTYENVSVTDYSAVLANSYRARGLLTAVKFVSKQDSFTTELNNQNIYGKNDWVTHSQRDVSSLKYDTTTRPEPQHGSTVNLLYSVENNVLYFGYNAGDGTLYLDRDEPYTRPI